MRIANKTAERIYTPILPHMPTISAIEIDSVPAGFIPSVFMFSLSWLVSLSTLQADEYLLYVSPTIIKFPMMLAKANTKMGNSAQGARLGVCPCQSIHPSIPQASTLVALV